MNQPNTAKTQTGFNLFAFLHGNDVYALGAKRHDEDLTEAEMLAFLPIASCHLTEPVWNDVRRLVELYDPVTQMVMVFLGPKTDSVYRLQIPARGN